MLFIVLLAFTTFCIAASAALFSVIGLMQTYSGVVAVFIMAMGISLEMGKLMAASALYRHWNQYKLWFKSFMVTVMFGLMVVTSIGIFGFLTAGYQKDSLPLAQVNQKLEADAKEVDRLIARKKEIDTQIAKLPDNYVSSRQKLMASFAPELKSIDPKIEALQAEIKEYQDKKINTETKIGPIIYVAKVLNRDPDESIFYFTFLLMCVFDPLAVGLTLATNIAINHRKESLAKERKDVTPVIVAATPTPSPSLSASGYKIYPTTPLPTPLPTPTPEVEPQLTKEDIIQIVKDNLQSEDIEALQRRKEILSELRK